LLVSLLKLFAILAIVLLAKSIAVTVKDTGFSASSLASCIFSYPSTEIVTTPFSPLKPDFVPIFPKGVSNEISPVIDTCCYKLPNIVFISANIFVAALPSSSM